MILQLFVLTQYHRLPDRWTDTLSRALARQVHDKNYETFQAVFCFLVPCVDWDIKLLSLSHHVSVD